MSAAHDDAHGYAAPEPVEITNPLLWSVFLLAACLALVWWFFHWLDSGRVEGRRGERRSARRPWRSNPIIASSLPTARRT